MCYVLSHFRRVQLFAALWTVAHQAPLSMGLSSQEYWSGLPCPPSGDLLDPQELNLISYISCTGSWVLYHVRHLGSPMIHIEIIRKS